ncbi:MAG: flagellar protein FliS [Sphingorhabdus sp.]
MNNLYRLNQAHNQYQSLALTSRLEATSPHGLVAVLYEELLRSLDVMAVAITRGKDLAHEVHSGRARTILIALEGSLDFERGAQVAQVLSGVYRAMQAQLRKVIAENSSEMLDELRSGVSEIATSWNQIAA